MGSQLFKFFKGTHNTAYFTFKNHCPSSCAFITKWTNVTKTNLEYQWSLWGTFEIPKLNFLKTEVY